MTLSKSNIVFIEDMTGLKYKSGISKKFSEYTFSNNKGCLIIQKSRGSIQYTYQSEEDFFWRTDIPVLWLKPLASMLTPNPVDNNISAGIKKYAKSDVNRAGSR